MDGPGLFVAQAIFFFFFIGAVIDPRCPLVLFLTEVTEVWVN